MKDTEYRRLFLAIPIEPKVPFLQAFAKFQDEFKGAKVTWVKPENMHLTLVFLGYVVSEDLYLLIKILKATRWSKAFELQFKGLRRFGRGRQTGAIFVDVVNKKPLVALQAELISLLDSKQIKFDHKNYHPHLTLGRLRKIRDSDLISSHIMRCDDQFELQQSVNSFHLYESLLTTNGPIYKSLLRLELF